MFILSGVLNTMTPQQNAGVFLGQINIGGWDANQKYGAGKALDAGLLNVLVSSNTLIDSFEMMDGVIHDQDFKLNYEWNF
ncbi:hypothetical protein [Alicyclobacillus vulcanalis]|uniref:Uncharacterized protein n=1 Tax=Alicyclobacillus vulcanalis TaxID=252246 RepID=A0A1N7JSD6_9BACL|nr:hypothetical protein SAMN05421799_101156 [Alicyclobacillus vulcanalis]